MTNHETDNARGADSSAPLTLETLAARAYGYFELATRDGEDEPYVRLEDGSPEWVRELVYSAHGELGPDDWRYARIAEALEHIAESGDDEDGSHEFADGAVDVYNGARLAWLGSSLLRAGYVDEACDEFGIVADSDTFERIGFGQYLEASEIFGAVLAALESRLADELEDEDEDEDELEDEDGRYAASGYICPFCRGPVSIDGRARAGELEHECRAHGWVRPIRLEGDSS